MDIGEFILQGMTSTNPHHPLDIEKHRKYQCFAYVLAGFVQNRFHSGKLVVLEECGTGQCILDVFWYFGQGLQADKRRGFADELR